MKITGTFLDEISHDIPSQNWGRTEWDRDFRIMKAAGISTVIMIRCGYKCWATYPSKVLKSERGAFEPPVDLVRMFLDLAELHEMDFYFGTFDDVCWWDGVYQPVIDTNLKVIEEAWNLYGNHPAFKGWYLTQELSRNRDGVVNMLSKIAKQCKDVSEGRIPVLVSPAVEGCKALNVNDPAVSRKGGITREQHEKEWDEIMAGISGLVDIVAFQDGHVDFAELPEFLDTNKKLADKHGLECWTNTETFDRDMPIKFLPIKWEKLRLKLEMARQAGIDNSITFEFSHFLSPYSCYPQAHGLFDRYCEYIGAKRQEFEHLL